MNTIIREAQKQDVNFIIEIINELGWFSNPDDITLEQAGRHLSQCLDDNSHSVYVAERINRVIGYIAVHWLPYLILTGPEGYVSELIIQESARGQGIGGKLLKEVNLEAKNRGCSRLMLVCGRGQDSYKRNFYNKQGWKERADVAYFSYLLA